MNHPKINELLDFLRFPSVSAQSAHGPDLRACAGWLVQKLERIGLDAQLIETPGHPVVLAASPRDPAKRTVLIYGHYDVQPPEPLALWETPPFEPVVRDGKIFARGSTDNKGQIFAHIIGVEEGLASGGLPVNVIFLIEGEEEVGSGHLATVLEKYREVLACDVVLISDTGMAADGYPTLSYALRGVAAMEVTISGPSHDLHSGVYGGAVANPATAAARLIATLHDADGRVAIEGFYDDVSGLEPWEREAAAAAPVTDADILEQTGSPSLFGEPGFSALERVGARPTAEVNGIGGGYQGEGSKTVLPSSAFFKLTFRLVPAQQTERILDLAEAHLRKHCPPGVRLSIERGHGGEPFFADPNSRDGLAARRAMEEVFGKTPALLREGGSIPILADFRRILGKDALLVALASPDCRAHSPNENFPVANFEAGVQLNQVLLAKLADA